MKTKKEIKTTEQKQIDLVANYLEELDKELKQIKKNLEEIKNDIVNSCAIYKGEFDALHLILEKGIKKANTETASVPTLEEVVNYFMETKKTMSAEKFYNYNDGRGWCIDGEPIKDWKKLADSWQKTQKMRK